MGESIGDTCLFFGTTNRTIALVWRAAVAAYRLACSTPSNLNGWIKLEASLTAMLAAIDFRGPSGREPPSHVDAQLAPQLLNMLLGLPAAIGEAAWAQ